MGAAKSLSLKKVKDVKSGYEVPYWWYDIRGFFIFHLSYQDSLFSLVRFFAKNYSDQHLEVAVGSGSFMELCLKWRALKNRKSNNPAGIAFDYMPSMLKGAKAKFGKSSSWKIEVQDVTRMTYPNESFQTINIANAFHCFSDPQASALELHRVLKTNGSLAVNVLTPPRGWSLFRRISNKVNAWGKRNHILVDAIDEAKVKQIFTSAGFSITQAEWSGNNLKLKMEKNNFFKQEKV